MQPMRSAGYLQPAPCCFSTISTSSRGDLTLPIAAPHGYYMCPPPAAASFETDDLLSKADTVLPYQALNFFKIDVFPSSQHPSVLTLELSDQELDTFCDTADAMFGTLPQHQVAGYPAPVQNDDMERDCQLVTNGLYLGTETAYGTEAARKLDSAPNDWTLLLQVDTDDSLGIMWGDAGKLYFWVEKKAARVGDFSNVWTILQCT